MKAVSIRLFLAVSCCALSFFVHGNVNERTDTIVLIANRQAGVSVLEASEVRAIFTGHIRTWPTTIQARPFVMPSGSPEHTQFCTSFLNTYPYQLERMWDRAMYSGYGIRPAKAGNANEMLEKIKSAPGGIGYVPLSAVDKKDSSIVIVEVKP